MPPRTDSDVIFSSKKIRCLLTHDHVLLRQGLRRLLEDEPDIEVVSEAGNAAECLRKVFEFRPDVLVADTETFGLPAAEAELLVRRESPETKIVFLSLQDRATPRLKVCESTTVAVECGRLPPKSWWKWSVTRAAVIERTMLRPPMLQQTMF